MSDAVVMNIYEIWVEERQVFSLKVEALTADDALREVEGRYRENYLKFKRDATYHDGNVEFL
jgi:hypothetical protein|tara:strand:- start:889 stop:1074 length:186 start_codon:yes stop_codon:yes gene_type:complete